MDLYQKVDSMMMKIDLEKSFIEKFDASIKLGGRSG
jgi:hypothetical protein